MYLREYELVYIAKPELDDDTYHQVGDRLAEVVEEAGGFKLHLDLWGKKRLAYEIDDFSKGMYFILDFLGEPSVVTEAERFLRFNDQVLRYMTVKLEDRSGCTIQVGEGEPVKLYTEMVCRIEDGVLSCDLI